MASTDASAPAPVPSSIVIPLPPGMNASLFFELQAFVFHIAICLSVVFAIILWDYFLLLADEIRLYRTMGLKIWRSPPALAFIILRYSGIVATFPALFFTAIQTPYCQVAASLSQVGVALSVGSSGLIFAYRVSAIWGRNKIVNYVVGFFYLVTLASWVSVGTQYHAVTGPPVNFGSNCQIQPIPEWTPISNASSVLFDAIILILTLMKLNSSRGTHSRIGYLVYRDSLLYFVITTSTNITVLVIQALPAKYALLKPVALPFSTLMTIAMGVRVFLNLKLFNDRENRADAGLPLTSHSVSAPRYPQTPGGVSVVRSITHYPALSPGPTNSEVYSGFDSMRKGQDSHLDLAEGGKWKD